MIWSHFSQCNLSHWERQTDRERESQRQTDGERWTERESLCPVVGLWSIHGKPEHLNLHLKLSLQIVQNFQFHVRTHMCLNGALGLLSVNAYGEGVLHSELTLMMLRVRVRNKSGCNNYLVSPYNCLSSLNVMVTFRSVQSVPLTG